ncbi:MAG: copper amine oxidase N-terminal domain-containing protein [Caldiserica bacterium]|jgi:hypothetical protein|nr:copper amine oxidase N-terminal domain-containing protein [Caldisericota bacterium]MDH7562646.1 copper amine oxidase N-terminal domain-containing protein [Caldisericota bacterium]
MKKFLVFGLVFVISVLGWSFFPLRDNTVAQPIVAYDFLANAASATWTGWIPGSSKAITFQVDNTSFMFSDGMASLVTKGVTLEDGTKHAPALWMVCPGGVTSSGVTGDFYNVYIPYNASLHVIFGLTKGDVGETGIVAGVAFAETDPTKPVLELISETKDYDGTLREATFDLSQWGGKTGGFQLFVRTPHADDADGAVWAYAAIEVNPTPSSPSPSISPLVLHFFIGNTTYFVGTTPKMMDIAPVIVESRTFLPIRYVAEELGAKVDWSQTEKKVTITMGSKKIELWIDQNSASVNGSFVLIDPSNPNVAPFILPPGRTMMPLRFISENLGSLVEWFPPSEARITYPAP